MARRRSGRRRHAAEEAGINGGSASHPAAAAASPSPPPPPPPPPPRLRPREDTPALRRRLVGLIRGFYIDAISRLPAADLRASLARGLLVGGHCYGPLHPVENIIANSVWYAAAFPLRAEDRVEVDVVCNQATDRAARRSLDGLLACLLHICPSLSPADALWQLVRSRADLRVAVAGVSADSASVRCARPSALRSTDREVVKAAFQMAAEAAKHPNPAAFALFASSLLLLDVEPDVSCLIASNSSISSLDIRRLSGVLLRYPLPSELSSHRSPPDPSPMLSQFISDHKRCATTACEWLLSIAGAALCKFTSETGIRCELHTIYGDSLVRDDCFNNYYHINFMAQRKEDHSSSSGAGLRCCLFFFAEAPNPPRHNIREDDISVCCLVEPSPADVDNCHTCLMDESKIDHPASDPVDRTHDLCIGGQCYEIGAIDHEWSFRTELGVDYLYFDSDRDSAFVEFLHNYFARIDAYCSGLSDDEAPRVTDYARQLAW